MYEEKIKLVTEQFASAVKKIYGNSLRNIILYGSFARGDFRVESDVDIMVLLDVPKDELREARKQILNISDQLDLDNDVVIAPVIQNYQIYKQYLQASVFYQNIQREGVRIA